MACGKWSVFLHTIISSFWVPLCIKIHVCLHTSENCVRKKGYFETCCVWWWITDRCDMTFEIYVTVFWNRPLRLSIQGKVRLGSQNRQLNACTDLTILFPASLFFILLFLVCSHLYAIFHHLPLSTPSKLYFNLIYPAVLPTWRFSHTSIFLFAQPCTPATGKNFCLPTFIF